MFYRISFIFIILTATTKKTPSAFISPFTIIGGKCEKNISVKYQVPVTRTRVSRQQGDNEILSFTEQYVEYEERIRWDTIHMCCPGYRTIIFGLCEPFCLPACPQHSYCSEPNKCVCMHGYEPSHHPNKAHQLICHPICTGGCPEHSLCKAHNKCECRAGFKDVSIWFSQLRCERIQNAAADHRVDLQKPSCIKIDMSVEELMQKVGEKLSNQEVDYTEMYDDKEIVNGTDC